MARQPKPQNTQPVGAARPGDHPILYIPIASVEVSGRLGAYETERAELIAASMAEMGQRSPITVIAIPETTLYRLVAGLHRLRAAEMLEWSDIRAEVMPAATTADEIRLIEIDENIARGVLSDLDQAVFLAERKAIYERLHPEVALGANQHDGRVRQIGEPSYEAPFVRRFSLETAEKLGLSERSIQRAVSRALRIAPEVRARIATTPLARKGGELDALAALAPDRQSAVVDLLLSDDEERPQTVKEALKAIEGRDAEADERGDLFSKFLKIWRKADADTKTAIRSHIQSER
jgi:ParB family transcriptional regulator, chromosome partitioning protein